MEEINDGINKPRIENDTFFESKYDNEFIGLLNEIGIRLGKFNKCDALKIKSWLNIFMVPCNTKEEKRNRNLYAIKLINQMVNGLLETPFIKFANSIEDMKRLSAANVKAELTKKFYEEVDFQNIENYGRQRQKSFMQNHPEMAEKIKFGNNNINENWATHRPKSPGEKKTLTKNKFTNSFSYLNVNNKLDNATLGNTANPKLKAKKAVFRKPLNCFYYNNGTNKYNKLIELTNKELINKIQELEMKISKRDQFIEYQNEQLEQLKSILSNLEKKNFLDKKNFQY